ncbi:vacuolar protein sorting-associated protein 11, putative [Plasmodium gallinaceum]|uniref:Vacuolar protein sorting-associated protein 11, putative n=1 Tax=Plasmodium gallinaceum TaxID=5849 RepID=A0A1J1GZA5_PLAGA|nr:vacuolar protein sorting-associated protein 11, putative [Plasmodium gallinaceum]CRG97797.1 vacuolar protein sorting-associated protein 11, putative [Plasmodium gallinaceum]
MFNFRRLPLFHEDQTKDTREIKKFLNNYEGIFFCSFNKFINVFLDKILFIDPSNLNVTTVSTNTLIVNFCFNDKTNNLIILGKRKNALICNIYNIKEYNFIHLKKINLIKNYENIKKALISNCLDYIITLENDKITFYYITNDYSINKSELIEDEDNTENVFLCKDDNLVILKKNCVNIYKLIKNTLSISYEFIESIKLNFSNNNNNNILSDESVLSIYNEEINVLYICHNLLKVLCVLNLNNRKFEYILLDKKIIDLFCAKFYLILLLEFNKKYYINIYIIYEDMKLIVFNTSFNYMLTNIIFFNNLLFFIIDDYVQKSETKIDKYYFYEHSKNNYISKEECESSRLDRSDSVSDIFIESEKTKTKNFDILKMYNKNINRGNVRNDVNINKKEDMINEENYIEEKKPYTDKFFKLNNKVFKNSKKKIKIVLKENNMNEIINIFKKKKLFHWLIKYSELNKNYNSVNFGYVYKIYADFLFEKEQYEKSLYQYIKTIGFLETSYVIHKYLNLDLYEYLSIYLEKLHELHLFNDEHTMMLLSCYKKECKKKKMITFIKNYRNKINLSKTYKFLLNIGYYNVVLKFSKRNKDHLTYISILIDKFENYEKSLKYIFKLDVENICILLFRYGYKFIKYFPELTIHLLKKIIKKYNLNLTIFIPLFMDNIDFLFIFILKFLDKKKEETIMDKNNNVDKRSLYIKKKVNDHIINNMSDNENSINIISRKKLEFDIFNGDYDYILFVTVMQILLQKYKKNEKNTILTHNIDKLIKNMDKNIKFLSLLLLSIYNYNKGLLNICKKINKFHISFLFSINNAIKVIKIKYNQKLLLSKNRNNSNYQLMDKQFHKILNKQSHIYIFNTCIQHFKLNYSFYNYIFYYLSLLNDDKFLIKFIKIIKKKSTLSLLNLILILQKYNKSYGCLKKIVISYLNNMDQNINSKYAEILKDKKELYKVKKKKLRNKCNFHLIENTYCSLCKEVLSIPIIHFLCNHSYHYYCLNENKVCMLCYNKDNEKKLLKEKAKNAVNNFDEFFKYLQGSTDKFSFISNYLSYGVTPNK